jgi:phosphoribosylformylglycinamidine cyclo-ligase
MAHITGGGLPENLPRCLRPGQSVQLSENSWPVPSIFAWLAQQGNIEPGEMFRAFNMGIGFVLIASPSEAESLVQWLTAQNLPAWRIGTVVDGDGAVLGIPQA